MPKIHSSKWNGKFNTEWMQINRQKANRNLVAHTAELGWNVPKEHDRHLLSLPIGTMVLSKHTCISADK